MTLLLLFCVRNWRMLRLFVLVCSLLSHVVIPPHIISRMNAVSCTVHADRMSRRKWSKTKQQSCTARSGHQICCCSVSLHFSWDIQQCIIVLPVFVMVHGQGWLICAGSSVGWSIGELGRGGRRFCGNFPKNTKWNGMNGYQDCDRGTVRKWKVAQILSVSPTELSKETIWFFFSKWLLFQKCFTL